MEFGIRGKRALVTGGSYGIGKAIALALVNEGCQVAICARGKSQLEQTVAELNQKQGGCIGFQVDVTCSSQIQQAWDTLIQKWETIDILINNVGGGGERVETPIEDVEEELWMKTYSLNTLAALRFTMKAIPLMRQRKWGRVVTIASIQGREGTGRPWYALSKSAEITLMKALARNAEYAKDGLTFNSIAPGTIFTEENDWGRFQQENPGKFRSVIQEKCPMGRPGTPDEIASVVGFVCSESASFMNGTCLVVDGGESRCL